MRFLRYFIFLLILLGLASQAARFLIVDDPQRADAIVVLAGDTGVRPARGLELLRQNMAPRLLIDEEKDAEIFGDRLTDLAQRYVDSLPEHDRITVCPIGGLSTNAETADVRRCMQSMSGRRILVVTSDFHTRRALSIFRKRLPEYQVSVASARDPVHFGSAWWTNREWAKVTFGEWAKMIWWEGVDRWRAAPR